MAHSVGVIIAIGIGVCVALILALGVVFRKL
jgi:hypothetical protein